MAKNSKANKKREDYTALYIEVRKKADREFKQKKFTQSCQHYLAAAKLIENTYQDCFNRLAALYAGAANAARANGKYVICLRYFEKAVDCLDDDQDNFGTMLQYIVDVLMYMVDRLKTEQQKKAFQALSNRLLKLYSRQLKAQPELSAKTSYLLNGSRISDKFASLESDSEATTVWLQDQALLSDLTMLSILAKFTKPKEFYQAAFAQMNSVPFKAGDYYFFSKTDQSGYITVRRGLASNNTNSKLFSQRAKVVFRAKSVTDSSSWMSGFRVNKKGTLLAYGMSKHGSDFETWKIRDLESGKDLADTLQEIPSGWIEFHRHKDGLVYRGTARQESKKDSHNNSNEKKDSEPSYKEQAAVYFHKFGTEQKKDQILHGPTTDWVDVYGLWQSKSHILISHWPTGKLENRLAIKSLTSGKVCHLFSRKAGYYSVLGEAKGKIYIRTDHQAPRSKILALTFDFKKMTVKSVEEILPESEFTLQGVCFLSDRLLVSALDDKGKTRLLQFDLDGKQLAEIKLPFAGTLSSLSTSYKDKNVFFTLENFATPRTIYHHDLSSGETNELYKPRYSMANRVVQELVQVKSKDGVLVPMNIAYLKGTKLNGKNATLLSVYGGFSIACLPIFSYKTATWLGMGGIWAQPYLRGGDELGADWHASATKEQKQRTFDDTIASAKWLIKTGFSSAKKIAICGGSNGGLTVGAAITQRPDLFGAAIADNGLFDMLKYAQHGLGWAWQSEYGSIDKTSEFQALKAYSPYHRAEKLKSNGAFPQLLINASAGDNRVVPWHSYKFAAACQQKGWPALLNVKWQEGHGWGRPDWSVRDDLAYLQWALKMV